MWDLDTSAALGEPLTGRTREVLAVAVGDFDGRAVAVSGGHDGSVRAWDLAAGVALGKPLAGDDEYSVLAVAVGELKGGAVVVSGGADGTVRV